MGTLNFKLNAKSGKSVDFSDFSDFSGKLNEALRRVHRSLDSSGRIPRYEVYQVEIGSIGCGIQSTGPGAICLKLFAETAEAIRSKTRPPINMTSADARAFRKLADCLDSHIESIVVNEEIPIDTKFVAGCEWLITSAPKGHGEAIGRLEALNVHNAKSFRIYAEGNDRGAECFFPDDFQSKVLSLVTKRVRVAGLVHRDPDGIGIDRITNIQSIELVPENDELPKLSDLLGLFKDSPVNVAAGWD